MTESEYTRALATMANIKKVLLRHLDRPALFPTAIKGLTLVRREVANVAEQCFEKPLASVIVQGRKHATIGTQEYHIHENQSIVAGVDMPSASYFIEATVDKPFLALFFYLDRHILTDLIMAMEPDGQPPLVSGQGVSVADAEPDFLEGVLRLMELLDKPEQIAIRAPLILRELHYLLLIGPQGGVLRGLYTQGSQCHQVVQAIALLRRHITAPLRVEDLARQVNMSVSSLHRHFKSVTGFSPLQYHKQLRLYEAQRMMLSENERAATAALAVGYESVTQFTREYKRMFGEPPHRDISRRRGYAL